MARMRTIKPGFFTNDQLAEIQPLGRLLFAGLWTMADREGRLEDRPKRIKAELLPYDECNADALLGELAQGGFIIRYEAAGHRYIQVTAFSKHQCPNVKELASTIPQPPENTASYDSTVPAQCQDDASISLIGTEQNNTEQEQNRNRTSSSQANEKPEQESTPFQSDNDDDTVSVKEAQRQYQKAANAKPSKPAKSKFTMDECLEFALKTTKKPPNDCAGLAGWMLQTGERDIEIAAYFKLKAESGAQLGKPTRCPKCNNRGDYEDKATGDRITCDCENGRALANGGNYAKATR